jgi:hypothetical protein
MTMEAVVRMRYIARSAPNRLTGLPRPPGEPIVGAEETVRPLPASPTHLAVAEPEPKRQGIA